MKFWKRGLCLLLCLVMLAGMGSALAVDGPLPDLSSGLSQLWDNMDLRNNLNGLDLSELEDALNDLDLSALEDALKDIDLTELTDALEELLNDSTTRDLDERSEEIRDRAKDFGLDLSERQLDELIDHLKDMEQGKPLKRGRTLRLFRMFQGVRRFFRRASDLLRRVKNLFGK